MRIGTAEEESQMATIKVKYGTPAHVVAKLEALGEQWSLRNANCNGMSFSVEQDDFDGIETGDAILDAQLWSEMREVLDEG